MLAFLTRGMPPLVLNAPTKTPAEYWSRGGAVELRWRGKLEAFTFPKSSDGELTVLSGELLTGVADKAVYAKFGLVHAVQARTLVRHIIWEVGISITTLHIIRVQNTVCTGGSRVELSRPASSVAGAFLILPACRH